MKRMKAVLLVIAGTITGAHCATNILTNGSFEIPDPQNGSRFFGWEKVNVPPSTPTVVIPYDTKSPYPTGAYGESVTPDNSISQSTDTVGNYAAYFVSDISVNETIKQSTYLTPGNYRIGFSYYLTANGLANVNNSSINASIIGIPVAFTTINSSSVGKVWFSATGVGRITVEGFYTTALTFNSNGQPAKDVIVDRIYAIPTTDPYTVEIPGTPDSIPEPTSLLLGIIGLSAITLRRKKG
jgi:hypothetical protein